jgi:hypothetical protein
MSLENPDLCLAKALSITFEFQKTDVQNETVHQYVTEHPILYPVLRWAAIIQLILAYPAMVATRTAWSAGSSRMTSKNALPAPSWQANYKQQ